MERQAFFKNTMKHYIFNESTLKYEPVPNYDNLIKYACYGLGLVITLILFSL